MSLAGWLRARGPSDSEDSTHAGGGIASSEISGKADAPTTDVESDVSPETADGFDSGVSPKVLGAEDDKESEQEVSAIEQYYG